MPLITHGYPDFNRVVSQSDVLFLHVFNDTISAPKTYPLGYVGNLPYLGISYDGVVQGSRVEIDFYADANFAILLTPFAIDVGNGGSFGGSVPVGGPFAQVTITPAGANLAYDIDVWSAPTEFGVYAARSTDSVLFFEKARSVGAGANFTYDTTRTFPAEAHLCIHTTCVAWNATLSAVDYLGTVTHINFIENAGANWNETLFLPASAIRLVVHNGDAGAKFFDVSLIARPWSPGR